MHRAPACVEPAPPAKPFLKSEVDAGHLPKPSKIALVWENTDHGKDYEKGVQGYVKANPGL